MKFARVTIHLMLGLVAGEISSGASVPALGIDPDTARSFPWLDHTNGTAGWTFRVLAPITVTDFGWYDSGRDGLNHPHQIGLWRNTDPNPPDLTLTNLLPVLSATILAGTEAPLQGAWRTVHLPTELSLGPGLYQIDGTSTPDPIDSINWAEEFSGPPFLPDSRIKVSTPIAYYGEGVRTPDQHYWYAGVLLGPMFFIQQIPEPHPAGLISVGLLALFARRCRVRKSRE